MIKLSVESKGALAAEAEAEVFTHLSAFGDRTSVVTDEPSSPVVDPIEDFRQIGRDNFRELVVELNGRIIATALCHRPGIVSACLDRVKVYHRAVTDWRAYQTGTEQCYARCRNGLPRCGAVNKDGRQCEAPELHLGAHYEGTTGGAFHAPLCWENGG